jgi:hypothetical protein
MNADKAIDVATKHRVVADRIINDCNDAELVGLALGLLDLYAHAARRLRTEMGWLAIGSMLYEIADHDEDLNVRHAAALTLAHQMTSTQLHEHGWFA